LGVTKPCFFMYSAQYSLSLVVSGMDRGNYPIVWNGPSPNKLSQMG